MNTAIKFFSRLMQWLIRVALFGLVLFFALNNRQMVELNLGWGYRWHSPLVVFLVLFFFTGAFIGVAIGGHMMWKRNRRRSQAEADHCAETQL